MTESIKETLKKILQTSRSRDPVFERNLLKEYFQVVVLDFVYSHTTYSRLFFYGGSCLAHCYGLPRLSEDLDFVDMNGEIDLRSFAHDIIGYLQKETAILAKTSCQKFRVYVKIPILHELGLANTNESDLLFLKVEVFHDTGLLASAKTEHIPLFKSNRSIIIKTFNLPTLMSTKIRAVLLRKWKRTTKDGATLATVKGRDYFDLMWYMEKGISPDLKYIPEVKNLEDLKNQLLMAVKRADDKSIRFDLEAFLYDTQFLKTASKNMKEILSAQINKL